MYYSIQALFEAVYMCNVELKSFATEDCPKSVTHRYLHTPSTSPSHAVSGLNYPLLFICHGLLAPVVFSEWKN